MTKVIAVTSITRYQYCVSVRRYRLYVAYSLYVVYVCTLVLTLTLYV